MHNATSRIILLIVYFIVSLGVGFMFAGSGHGSYAPFPILFSWGYCMCGVLGFVVMPLLYLIGLLFLHNVTSVSDNPRIVYIPAVIHVLGSVVLLSQMDHGYLNTPGWMAESLAVSVPLVLAYLTLSTKLAQNREMPEEGLGV